MNDSPPQVADQPSDGRATEDPAPIRISEVAQACWASFSTLLETIEDNAPLAKRLVTEYQQRYASWIGYLGVFAQNNLSLDHRLRNTGEVRSLVIHQLQVTQQNLRTALELARNHDGHSHQSTEPQMPPALRATFAGIEAALDRLHRLGASIRHASAGQLMDRMKPFAKDERLNAFERLANAVLETLYPAASTGLIEHICRSLAEKYQKMLYLEARGKQYGHASRVQRRQNINPWINKKKVAYPLRSGLKAATQGLAALQIGDAQDQTSAGPVGGGNLPSLKSSAFSKREFGRDYQPSNLSQSSPQRRTQSIATNRALYTAPQILPEDAHYADCQWCFKNYPASMFNTPERWREHQKQDWQPYVCLSEECARKATQTNKPISGFASSVDWQRHMVKHSHEWSRNIYKQKVWVCNLDFDADTGQRKISRFMSEAGFVEHLEQSHPTLSVRQIQRLARHSTIHSRRDADICPLCCLSITGASGTSVSDLSAAKPADSVGNALREICEEPEDIQDASEKDSMEAQKSRQMTKHVADHLYSLTFLILRLLSLGPNDSGDDDSNAHSVTPPGGDSTDGTVSDYQNDLVVLQDEPTDPNTPQQMEQSPAMEEAQFHGNRQTESSRLICSCVVCPHDWYSDDMPSRCPKCANRRVRVFNRAQDSNGCVHEVAFETTSSAQKGTSRSHNVAWITRLNLEFTAAWLMLDERLDDPSIKSRPHHIGEYVMGSMGGQGVVLAHFPQPGVGMSFIVSEITEVVPTIQLFLFVGIGGGVPRTPTPHEAMDDVHLGDVVVGYSTQSDQSKVVAFRVDEKNEDIKLKPQQLSCDPVPTLASVLSQVQAQHRLYPSNGYHEALKLTSQFEASQDLFRYPDEETDVLYHRSYKHRGGAVCDGCDPTQIVSRPQRQAVWKAAPQIHRAAIASGNLAVKDGEMRDKLWRACQGALCLETGLSGDLSQVNRACLVIRGISDYCDSHQTNLWQGCAAGNAALVAKELLLGLPPTDAAVDDLQLISSGEWAKRYADDTITMRGDKGARTAAFVVPYERNYQFVGRKILLQTVVDNVALDMSSGTGTCFVLSGLPAIGKTEIAIEAAYLLRAKHPHMSIYWLSARDQKTITDSFVDIARAISARVELGVQTGERCRTLVYTHLSRHDAGPFLLIVDGDEDAQGLHEIQSHLPMKNGGTILATARHIGNEELGMLQKHIAVGSLTEGEAIDLLRNEIGTHDSHHKLSEAAAWVQKLQCHPLAIKYAALYMRSKNIALSEFVPDDADLIHIFRNSGSERRHDSLLIRFSNAILGLREDSAVAEQCLQTASLLAERPVPISLLLDSGDDEVTMQALVTLRERGFITQTRITPGPGNEGPSDPLRFDVHRVVRLIIRDRLKTVGEWTLRLRASLTRLSEKLEVPYSLPKEGITRILPHALAALEVGAPGRAEHAFFRVQLWTAQAFDCLDNFQRASLAYQKAQEVQPKPERAADTFQLLTGLGLVVEALGRSQESEALLDESFKACKKLGSEMTSGDLSTLRHMASWYVEEQRVDGAYHILLQLLWILEEGLGTHPQEEIVEVRNQMIMLLLRSNSLRQAIPLMRKQIETKKALLGEKHPQVASAVEELNKIYEDDARDREQAGYDLSYLTFEKPVTEQDAALAGRLDFTVDIPRERRWLEQTADLLEEVLDIRRTTNEAPHPDTQRVRWYLASAYFLLSQSVKAGELADALPLKQDPDGARVLMLHAAIAEEKRELDKAAAHHRRLMKPLWNALLSEEHQAWNRLRLEHVNEENRRQMQLRGRVDEASGEPSGRELGQLRKKRKGK